MFRNERHESTSQPICLVHSEQEHVTEGTPCISRPPHEIVDCPVCGRPVEVTAVVADRHVACGHCGGEFTLHRSKAGALVAGRETACDPMERADELLSVERLPAVVLVECRDEAFARLATDMAACGFRVIRATSSREALKHCVRYRPALVVISATRPNREGWLLAAKLRFVDPLTQVWLYQTGFTSYDRGMAEFLRVDTLIDDRGDLLGLSERLVDLVFRKARGLCKRVADLHGASQPAA